MSLSACVAYLSPTDMRTAEGLSSLEAELSCLRKSLALCLLVEMQPSLLGEASSLFLQTRTGNQTFFFKEIGSYNFKESHDISMNRCCIFCTKQMTAKPEASWIADILAVLRGQVLWSMSARREEKEQCSVVPPPPPPPPPKQPLGWRLTLAVRKFCVVPKSHAWSQTIKLDPLNCLVSCWVEELIVFIY